MQKKRGAVLQRWQVRIVVGGAAVVAVIFIPGGGTKVDGIAEDAQCKWFSSQDAQGIAEEKICSSQHIEQCVQRCDSVGGKCAVICLAFDDKGEDRQLQEVGYSSCQAHFASRTEVSYGCYRSTRDSTLASKFGKETICR